MMDSAPTFNLVASKYDGTIYRVFTNNVLLEDDDDKSIFYSKCGSAFFNVRTNTKCYSSCDEFIVMMKKEHFNIVILLHAHQPTEYYVNLTLLPEPAFDSTIKYIDMDIDLSFTSENRAAKILDRDEYDQNSLIYNYSKPHKETINSTLQNLKLQAESDYYLFSDSFVQYCQKLLTMDY